MNENTNGSYVYLLHAQGTNRFKIGYSEDPVRRARSINAYSSPFPVVLVACYLPKKHPYSEEQRLHKELIDRKVYKEWFEFDSVDQAKEIVQAKIGVPDIKNSHNYYGITPSIEPINRLFFKLTNKLNANEKKKSDKIIITRTILKEMIDKAIQDLTLEPKNNDNYAAKACALQLFTGKKIYDEIFNAESSFLVKTSANLLTQSISGDESIELIESNLTLVRRFILEKAKCTTPTRTLLLYPIMRSLMSYDKLLKEVRDINDNMPRIADDGGRRQYLRSFYAFSCWVFLDQCQSSESEYIDSLFEVNK